MAAVVDEVEVVAGPSDHPPPQREVVGRLFSIKMMLDKVIVISNCNLCVFSSFHLLFLIFCTLLYIQSHECFINILRKFRHFCSHIFFSYLKVVTSNIWQQNWECSIVETIFRIHLLLNSMDTHKHRVMRSCQLKKLLFHCF